MDGLDRSDGWLSRRFTGTGRDGRGSGLGLQSVHRLLRSAAFSSRRPGIDTGEAQIGQLFFFRAEVVALRAERVTKHFGVVCVEDPWIEVPHNGAHGQLFHSPRMHTEEVVNAFCLARTWSCRLVVNGSSGANAGRTDFVQQRKRTHGVVGAPHWSPREDVIRYRRAPRELSSSTFPFPFIDISLARTSLRFLEGPR